MEGKHRIIRVMSVLVCWEKPLLPLVHLYRSFYLEMQVCSKYYIHEHIITLCSEVAIFMLSLGTYLKNNDFDLSMQCKKSPFLLWSDSGTV